MNSKETLGSQSEQTVNTESVPSGTSWSNPGEFPPFDSKKAARERARTTAEIQYQNELTRPYEQDKDGITGFAIESAGKKIDGYEFTDSDFKMLVSVVGAVGQSLGNQPQEVDPAKWANSSREYISTSLISDKKMNLFSPNGLIFGFNNLNQGDFLSAAPTDHGILRDIGKMEQYKDEVMGPDELLEATGTGLTPWNEVEISGDTKPDSIIVFGDTKEAISDEDKEAAEYFDVPIYLIRTDRYGRPASREEIELSDEAKEFWKDRKDAVSGRIEKERAALLDSIKDYYETGNVGDPITKYLSGFDEKIQQAKENSSNQEEFVKNLIDELGSEEMARLKERIEDGN